MSLLRAAAAVALLLHLSMPALAADEVAVVVSGQRLSLDVPPIIIAGRTLVHLRAILEAVGATVDYDSASRTVTATKGGLTLVLPLGERRAAINGREAVLDVPAQVVNGRTLVPVPFVAEALGARVEWDAAARTVRVTPGSQTAPAASPNATAAAHPTWWSTAMQRGCSALPTHFRSQTEGGAIPRPPRRSRQRLYRRRRAL